MKTYTLLLLATGALALAGCSTSAPTKVDTGPVHARTFNFVAAKPKPALSPGDNLGPLHALVQESITRSLAQRGVTKVAAGGDVTVAYLIITGNNASATSISDYFGSRADASALLDQAHTTYTGSKNPNYFQAGTLVIDLIDPKTFKLLWRGNASRQMLQNPTADVQAARLQEVVDDIFSGLRIVP